MKKVTIVQLDENGAPMRSFEFSRHPREIPAFIEGTRRGYNMDHTQILVNGKLVAGKGKD